MLSVVILIEAAQKTFNYWCLWKEKCCFAGKKKLFQIFWQLSKEC